MAQTRMRTRTGLGRTLRRLGFGKATLAVMACVVLVMGTAVVGVTSQLGTKGLVVERADDSKADDGGTDSRKPQTESESGKAKDEQEPQSPAESPEGGSQLTQSVEQPAARYIVHVDGAVTTPGVIELTGDDVRVGDAVEAAGGLSEDADTSTVNLAEPLVDGSKIHVPHRGELEEVRPTQTQEPPSGQTGDAAGQGGQASETTSPESGGLVNINTATSEELQTLSGVGEATARAIIEEREANGPFTSPEDIMRVSGIGEKKFAKIAGSICV